MGGGSSIYFSTLKKRKENCLSTVVFLHTKRMYFLRKVHLQCTQYSNEDEECVIVEFLPYGNTQFQPNGTSERQPSGIAQIGQGNLYNQQMIICFIVGLVFLETYNHKQVFSDRNYNVLFLS